MTLPDYRLDPPDGAGWCPADEPDRVAFEVDWLWFGKSEPSGDYRRPTPQENNDAQSLTLAAEQADGSQLAALADWTPARVHHALQIGEAALPRYEEGRLAPVLLVLLAKRVRELEADAAARARTREYMAGGVADSFAAYIPTDGELASAGVAA